jgi:serine/threonine protein phosphatase PrpC
MSLTKINTENFFKDDNKGKVRSAQEDSHGVAERTPNGDVFVVCDGMGGHVGGQVASSMAVERIIDHLKKEKYANAAEALDGALQYANVQILGHTYNHPELKGMGTTACVLLLRGKEAYLAHVGDSRIYLYLGKEKELYRVTKDHSYVQQLVDLPEGHPDKITDDEAESHPNKNRILKALGIKADLQPTVTAKPILPKNGDVFLICSDGLNGMISDKMIRNVLSGNATIRQKGTLLIDLALEAGGHDNITVELIQISNSPWKKSVYQHCNFNPKISGKSPDIGGKIVRKVLKWTAVAAAILLVGFVGWWGYNRYEDRRLDQRIEELEKTVYSLEKDHDDSTEEIRDINQKITDWEKSEVDQSQAIQDKKTQLEMATKKQDRLTADLQDAKTKLENLKRMRDERNNNRQGSEQ